MSINTSGLLKPPEKFFNGKFSEHTSRGTSPRTKESDDISHAYSKGLAEKAFNTNISIEYIMTEESKESPMLVHEQARTQIS